MAKYDPRDRKETKSATSGGRPKSGGTSNGNPGGGGTPAGTRGGVTNPKTNIKEKNPPSKNYLGKTGPYKPSNVTTRNPLKYDKNLAGPIQSYEATPANLASLAGGTLLGAAMPGIGIGLGPVGAQATGFGYDNPTGTKDNYSYDASQKTPLGGENSESSVQAMTGRSFNNNNKKKPKRPTGNAQLLAGMPGTLLGA